jgi:hypothetical protein
MVRRRRDGLDVLHTGDHAAALGRFLENLRKWSPGGLPANIQNRLFWPPLLFTLRLNDPLFFNFTETPPNVRTGEPGLWLSNGRAEAIRNQDGKGRAMLPQTARIAVDWSRPTMLVHRKDPPKLEEEGKEAVVLSSDLAASAAERARDLWDDTRPDAEAKAAAESGPDPLGQWWFEPAGDIEASKKERSDMRSGFGPRPLPLGFVEIHLSPAAGTSRRESDAWYGFPLDLDPPESLPGGATADSGGYVRPSRYEIRFEARKTRWRYLVAGRRRGLDETRFSISDSDRKHKFHRRGHAVLPSGEKAIRFESREALPLKQRAKRTFALYGPPEAGSDRERKLIDPLPVPTADLILPDPHPPPAAGAAPAAAPARTVWSEIYVFV